MKKHCNVCGKDYDPDLPDPCLGRLPGVSFACCGHDKDTGGYIRFENGVTIYFEASYIIDYSNLPVDAYDEGGNVRESAARAKFKKRS